MVRVWRLAKDSQVLEASMKDHKGSVNAIQVRDMSGVGFAGE